jgi:DNA-binding MarR family transcriptional regulator
MSKEVYEKLTRLQHLLHKWQIRSHIYSGPLDASRGQGRIIAALKETDSICTKDLAETLGINISTLNEMLVKLEKGKFIRREPSADDKRVILLALTDKGKGINQSVVPSIDLFAGFTENEQTEFAVYIDRIIAVLLEKLGGDDERDGCFDFHGHGGFNKQRREADDI